MTEITSEVIEKEVRSVAPHLDEAKVCFVIKEVQRDIKSFLDADIPFGVRDVIQIVKKRLELMHLLEGKAVKKEWEVRNQLEIEGLDKAYIIASKLYAQLCPKKTFPSLFDIVKRQMAHDSGTKKGVLPLLKKIIIRLSSFKRKFKDIKEGTLLYSPREVVFSSLNPYGLICIKNSGNMQNQRHDPRTLFLTMEEAQQYVEKRNAEIVALNKNESFDDIND